MNTQLILLGKELTKQQTGAVLVLAGYGAASIIGKTVGAVKDFSNKVNDRISKKQQ